MSAARQDIITSYRSLYRHALHAVQYSSPARYTVKAVMESTYRNGNPADFDPRKVNNTLIFLEGAAKEKGLEHRILKNLLHTWWWENKQTRSAKDQSVKAMQMKDRMSRSTINHFEITLKMLNESMGMCLPTSLVLARGMPQSVTTNDEGEGESEQLVQRQLDQ